VGIELKATLKTRKLLILLNAKNAKNIGFAQPRYTAGTRNCFAHGQLAKRTCLSDDETKSLCLVVEGIEGTVLTPLAMEPAEATGAR
jgi:hypothetical protein